MTSTRVWLLYEPVIYSDLFQRIFERFGSVHVVNMVNRQMGETIASTPDPECVDVIIVALDEAGQIPAGLLSEFHQDAIVLAFSPKGDRGLRRQPGENKWEEIRPFGLADLIFEVLKSTRSAARSSIREDWQY